MAPQKRAKPTKSTRSTKRATPKRSKPKWLLQPSEAVYFRFPLREGAGLTPEVLEAIGQLSHKLAEKDAIAANVRCGPFVQVCSVDGCPGVIVVTPCERYACSGLDQPPRCRSLA
jgi:hypothetical protein